MSSKKRRLCAAGEGTEETKREAPKGMAFTCICFGGKMYTTDEDGHFLHPDPEAGHYKLYRCEVNEMMDVVFTLLRSVNDAELAHMEHKDDLNVMHDARF